MPSLKGTAGRKSRLANMLRSGHRRDVLLASVDESKVIDFVDTLDRSIHRAPSADIGGYEPDLIFDPDEAPRRSAQIIVKDADLGGTPDELVDQRRADEPTATADEYCRIHCGTFDATSIQRPSSWERLAASRSRCTR